ncbi:MAG: hypothetical protein HKM24_00185 [Gammaproteobacteria bacterium]|nr:hypothetical protein [Gammaproteobacteria bacterium]
MTSSFKKTVDLAAAKSSVAMLLMVASTVVMSAEVATDESKSESEPMSQSRGFAKPPENDKAASYQSKFSGKPDIEAAKEKPRDASKELTIKSHFHDHFWIYSAYVDLHFDEDYDGFYTGVDVSFDADTTYFAADVYALLYLSYEGGPWRHYFTSDYFTIFGGSGSDDYYVETDLISGYETGYYDVLIELYDASYGDHVASFGPLETSELSDLPLEDEFHDTGYDYCDYDCVSSVSYSGGGSLSWLNLLLLLTAIWHRYEKATGLRRSI